MTRTLAVVALLLVAPVALPPAAPAAPADGPDGVQSITMSCNPGHAVQFMDHDETTSPPFVCSGHFGIHTYFVGDDEVYRLRGGCLGTRPVEVGAVGLEVGASALPPIEPGFAVEVSLDGATWDLVAYYDIPHNPAWVLLGPADNAAQFPRTCTRMPIANPSVGPGAGAVGYPNRVTMFVVLPDTGQEFRFLRLRTPASALAGLSGYLDTSGTASSANPTFAGLLVERVRDAPATPAPGTVELDCSTDLVDSVFPDHPCRYGGLNHFDAASESHTYWLDRSELRRVSGHATFMPYRVGQLAREGSQWSGVGAPIRAHLQGSCDGSRWAILGTFEVPAAGEPAPFDFNLTAPVPTATCPDARDARFLRIVTQQYIVNGDQSHWYAGYVLDSHLTLEGNVTAPASRGAAGSTVLAGQSLMDDASGLIPDIVPAPAVARWTNATGGA